MERGSITVVGVTAHYWSATASTSTSNAYSLDSDATPTYPSASRWRWLGYSVRCVAIGYYVRSGMVNMYHGKYLNVNNQSNLWSGKADQTDAAHGAFMMIISASQIAPAYSNYEWVGFPLRCLAW